MAALKKFNRKRKKSGKEVAENKNYKGYFSATGKPVQIQTTDQAKIDAYQEQQRKELEAKVKAETEVMVNVVKGEVSKVPEGK